MPDRKNQDPDDVLTRVEAQAGHWRGRALGAEELAKKGQTPLERETLLRRAAYYHEREVGL